MNLKDYPALDIPERELVEFAAKAVGIELMWSSVADQPPFIQETLEYWKPRENGDDALNLAADLDIQIEQIGVGAKPTNEVSCYPRGRGDCNVIVPHGDDKRAATRLAIFYAAALLGMSKSAAK